MTAHEANTVRGVANEHIEMLARRAMQHVDGGPKPETPHLARPAFDLAPLIREVGAHGVAEVAAELRRKQPEEPSEQPVVKRRARHA